MNIAIFGPGNVGSVIAQKLSAKHSVTLGTRDANSEKIKNILLNNPRLKAADHVEAASEAEVIIITMHPPHIKELLSSGDFDFSQKVVIDCSNEVFEKVDFQYDSATKAIAALTNCTKITKAFNTTGAENIGKTVNGSIDTFIAGEEDAKKVASEIANDLGFNPVDAGGIENTHALEEMARIWITVCRGKGDFNSYFKLLR